jgi:hypothetical protein
MWWNSEETDEEKRSRDDRKWKSSGRTRLRQAQQPCKMQRLTSLLSKREGLTRSLTTNFA